MDVSRGRTQVVTKVSLAMTQLRRGICRHDSHLYVLSDAPEHLHGHLDGPDEALYPGHVDGFLA